MSKRLRRCLSYASILLLLILCGFTLAGCESDPILSPQSDEEEDNGSYGTSNLLSGATDPQQARRSNPELF